jgi:hypothetical protein
MGEAVATRAKGRAFTRAHRLEDLEQELIQQLYVLRDLEEQILACTPQTRAPAALREIYREARVRLNQLEVRIRQLRHGF